MRKQTAQTTSLGKTSGAATSGAATTRAVPGKRTLVEQCGGIGIVQCKTIDGGAGDPLERHADAVADRVVRGESAVDLLDSMTAGAPVVQRKEEEGWGAADSGFKRVVRDTYLYRYVGGERDPLRRTTNLLRAQMVVRTRPRPASEPPKPGY